MRDIVLSGREPFVYDHPVFKLSKGGSRVVKIPRATGPIKMDGSMKGWPGLPAELLGSNLVQGANPGSLSATFKVCWDDRNFYFWAHVVDPIPMKNGAKGASLYQGDGIELFFGPQNLDETGPLLPTDRHIALSANSTVGPDSVYFVGQAASLPCEMTVIPDVDGGGYTLEAAIPFTSLGFTPKEGTEVRFDIALNDSETGTARTRQFMWNGTSRNSKERKDWGRAVFNP